MGDFVEVLKTFGRLFGRRLFGFVGPGEGKRFLSEVDPPDTLPGVLLREVDALGTFDTPLFGQSCSGGALGTSVGGSGVWEGCLRGGACGCGVSGW